MKPPFPSAVENWHNDTYAAIDPTQPKLSAAGKTVVITGGGTGIGRATVESFAQAKAASITITGRRLAPLEETKKFVETKYGVPVHIFSADVVDGAAMRKVAAEVGGWDIFVHNAGYMSELKSITETDIDEWWRGWEINVKGPFVVWQSFHDSAKKGAVFISTVTAAVTLPLHMAVTQSSYIASKQGLIKALEILANEEKEISVRFFHPGVIDTDMGQKNTVLGSLPLDKVTLPADFTVWFATPEAAFLAGRIVSCNWDIDELKAVQEQLPGSNLFLTGLNGFGGPSLAQQLKL